MVQEIVLGVGKVGVGSFTDPNGNHGMVFSPGDYTGRNPGEVLYDGEFKGFKPDDIIVRCTTEKSARILLEVALRLVKRFEPVEHCSNVCTCHERDSSFTCDYCKSQGHYGHMERAPVDPITYLKGVPDLDDSAAWG